VGNFRIAVPGPKYRGRPILGGEYAFRVKNMVRKLRRLRNDIEWENVQKGECLGERSYSDWPGLASPCLQSRYRGTTVERPTDRAERPSRHGRRSSSLLSWAHYQRKTVDVVLYREGRVTSVYKRTILARKGGSL